MEANLERKRLRSQFSSLGWALVIYLLILNAAVLLVAMVDMILIAAAQMGGTVFTEEEISAMVAGNGTGYLLTISIGLIALRLWKGKTFCGETLWTRGKPMKLGDFLCLVCVFLGGQLAFQVIASAIEAFLNLFGLSALDSIEAATMSADSISMFLYAAIGAPIAEELLFRGLVLRQLEPYGKRFAIVLSAFAFAVFHGNLVQIPYAFLVGLVLGYTAMEYNICWAMVMHMINNLVLADMLPRLTAGLPELVANGIFGMIILFCGVASVVILIVRWKEIRAYRQENKIQGSCASAFFTSPGIITLMILTLFTLASPLVSQIIEKLE